MRDEFAYLGKDRNDGLSFGDPGQVEGRRCGVCNSQCVVERNVNGPTSRWEAMEGRGHAHDVFRCPHYNSEWHNLAYELIREMGKTASDRIRALVKADLDDLLVANLPPDRPVRCGKCCSQCGNSFDICCEQVCPDCGSVECAAYKPWMRGCNSTDSCAHRSACEWNKTGRTA